MNDPPKMVHRSTRKNNANVESANTKLAIIISKTIMRDSNSVIVFFLFKYPLHINNADKPSNRVNI